MGVLLGLPAVLLGHFDLRSISSGNMDPDGKTQTRIGMILGYVGLGLSVLVFLLCGTYRSWCCRRAMRDAGVRP